MLRKASEAVSEGNVPVHEEEELGFGQPAPVNKFREIRSHLNKLKELMRPLEQHLLSQEQDARLPRLAMEADETSNTKTQERMEGVAKAVQAMRGDSCTAEQIVQDGPKTSITFGVEVGPPDLPCWEDFLVEEGATSPESCLPSLEMRSPTAAGGLFPIGEASTATETTSNESLLRFYATEEMNPEGGSKEKNSWTSIPSASYDSNSFWRLLVAPSCYRVVETKSRQNKTFDPGGSRGHLRACPFLGSWRTLICGEVIRAGAAGDELQRFFEGVSLALRNKAGFDAVTGKSLTVEGGSRLHELEGRTEVTSSMTARGCQG